MIRCAVCLALLAVGCARPPRAVELRNRIEWLEFEGRTWSGDARSDRDPAEIARQVAELERELKEVEIQ